MGGGCVCLSFFHIGVITEWCYRWFLCVGIVRRLESDVEYFHHLKMWKLVYNFIWIINNLLRSREKKLAKNNRTNCEDIKRGKLREILWSWKLWYGSKVLQTRATRLVLISDWFRDCYTYTLFCIRRSIFSKDRLRYITTRAKSQRISRKYNGTFITYQYYHHY